VNPYDLERTADAYYRALTLPRDDRTVRMHALRRRVFAFDVHRWAETFLEQLGRVEALPVLPGRDSSPAAKVDEVVERLRAAEHLVLLLDYDGTLMSFAPTPELAQPDPALMSLLKGLSERPRTTVHVVTGRPRETVEGWFGALPVGLHAEHGLWSRFPGGGWTARRTLSMSWREPVLRILRDFASRTPGATVEEKSVSVAWHYRQADPVFGDMQANELKLYLIELLSNTPVEVLPGSKVIEVRPHGIHKGGVVAPIIAASPRGAQLAAIGDDRTDEDMFNALPPEAVAIHVGPTGSVAPLRVAEVADARRLLERLLGGG
jgi:trehalose 6-phosphate synthase/phosphatase